MWVGQGRGGNPPASALPARRPNVQGRETPPRARNSPPNVQGPQARGPGPAPGTAGQPASGGRRWESGSAPGRPAPGAGHRGPREEGTRVYKQRGGGARESAREGKGLPVSGSRRRPVCGLTHPARCRPSRPVQPSPAPGSGACCPAAAAAAAAAGSSQGRRRRHRDATPQCISSHPHRPHCPAACRWGRRAARSPRHDSS